MYGRARDSQNSVASVKTQLRSESDEASRVVSIGPPRLFRGADGRIDPYGRFLKLADVMKSIGVSQAMVYKLMKDEKWPFPKPIKVGRAALWVERDVVAWKAEVVSANE